MKQHKSLNLLMDTLFANNSLTNWSIYEEKSGNIVVRLRFTKIEDGGNDTNVIRSQSFRKKSEAQAKRDRERAARHRSGVTTRSQAAQAATESAELARGEEQICDSDTLPPDMSPVVELDPEALSFDPCSVSHSSATGDSSTIANDTSPTVMSEDLYCKEYDCNMSFPPTPDDVPCGLCCFECLKTPEYHGHKTIRCDTCNRYICQLCYLKTRHFEDCPRQGPITYVDT